MKQKLPTLDHEKKLWEKEFLVIGIDEVGRGAFAGPLMVGAVCFKTKLNQKEIKRLESLGINDSKKLTPEKREKLVKIIKKEALFYSTAKVSVAVINQYGISKATQMAVRKVIKGIMNKELRIKNKKIQNPNRLPSTIDYPSSTNFYVLMDAFYIKYLKGIGLKNQKAIIHGDEISLSIAAASIIAKVTRDKLMSTLAKDYRQYNWDKNKGYGTKDHIEAIKNHGKTELHREMFIRNLKAQSAKIKI